MSFRHVIVWIDHAKGHVIHFDSENVENEEINVHSTHSHLHTKSGTVGAGRAPEDVHFFNDVANAIRDASEILIVGPDGEKLMFVKHLLKHHHLIAEKVVSVEMVDHPSDGQLLKFARKYFVKVDLVR